MNSVQTPQSRLSDITHSMVGMKGFLKAQLCSPSIPHLKLEGQLSTERCAMDQTQFGGPRSLVVFVAFGEHADCDRILGLRYRLELPRLRAYDAVRRRCGIVRPASKPGKTD